MAGTRIPRIAWCSSDVTACVLSPVVELNKKTLLRPRDHSLLFVSLTTNLPRKRFPSSMSTRETRIGFRPAAVDYSLMSATFQTPSNMYSISSPCLGDEDVAAQLQLGNKRGRQRHDREKVFLAMAGPGIGRRRSLCCNSSRSNGCRNLSNRPRYSHYCWNKMQLTQ